MVQLLALTMPLAGFFQGGNLMLVGGTGFWGRNISASTMCQGLDVWDYYSHDTIMLFYESLEC